MIKLFEDQQRQVDKVVAAMQAGHRSILMQAPTGCGKSVMASYMVHRALQKGNTVWFLVPRRNLIKQMQNTFNEFGVQHSYIAAGNSLNPHEKAHICSTDTLRRRIKDGKITAQPEAGKVCLPKIAFVDER